MSRQLRSSKISAPPADSQVLRFISRAEQLRLRGKRNFDRYMLFTKGFVTADGPERRQWKKEWSAEEIRDAAWDRRHGTVPDGATILQWQHESGSRSPDRLQASALATTDERSRSHDDGR